MHPLRVLLLCLVLPCLVLPCSSGTVRAADTTTISPSAEGSPGTLAAEYATSSIGASTYSIALQVPPGTAGMEPSLGLQYNNQQSDGLLGLGFSLTGLSAINRCEATQPLDGYIGAVRFQASDRFCLDGNRLILVGSGRYGEPGTRYHTENETWTEVTAVGRCGTGPCSFTAKNKDGWTLDFGGAADSRTPLPGGDTVVSWQIARTTDLNGNSVAVSYARDATALENLPSVIRYTANAAQGLAAQREVHFTYEQRPNPMPKYEGGARFSASRRLQSIHTQVLGQRALTWRLAYDTSASSGRSLLRSVTACGADNLCLPPTTFDWQTTQNVLVPPAGNASGELLRNWCVDGETASRDFNGDGRPDLLCVAGRVLYAQLSTGSGLKPASSQAGGRLNAPANWCADSDVQWADFNGDRKADALCADDTSQLRALLSTGKGLASPNSRADGLLTVPRAWCDASKACRVGWTNFDGDGRADATCDCDNGDHRVLVSTGRDLQSPNSSADGVVVSRYCNATGAQSFWSDFDGDGQSDLHCRADATQSVLVSDGSRLLSPNASATGVLTNQWCGGDAQLATLDFNGDGLNDLYCRRGDSGTHQIMLSGGNRIASPNLRADGTVRSGWCTGKDTRADSGDFNGDGLDDLVCHQNDGTQATLLSTGSEVRPPGSDPNGVLRTAWCGGKAHASGTDFNGDALSDLWCSDATSGTQSVLVHKGPFPDLLTGIRNGLGGGVAVEYAPLTDDRIYSTGTPATFPVLDVRSPLYVVRSATHDDGQGARYALDYHYTGARTDLERRRWLGFEAVTATTRADGRYSTTRYVQDYPVVAFIGEARQYAADGRLLSSAEFTPVATQPYPNVHQVLRASETSSTYTQGKADYVYEQRNRYDAYGNPALTADLGDMATPDDDVFDCWRYDNRTGADWRLGYVLLHKTARTEAACNAFLAATTPAWDPATDLRYERSGYDAAMNIAERGIWDDRNALWLTQRSAFDGFGNATALTDWAGNTTSVDIDTTFRTFTVANRSPALRDGLRLTVQYDVEPLFGNQRSTTDANGNQQRSVFDSLGRERETWGPDPDAANGSASVKLGTQSYGRDSRGNFTELRERHSFGNADEATWPNSRAYVDGMGRARTTIKSGPAGGGAVITEQRYDTLGRPSQSSYPRFDGTPAVWSTSRYDVMDRLIRLEHGDGSVQTYDYLQGQLRVRAVLAGGTPDERSVVNHNSVREVLLQSTGRNEAAMQYRYDPVLQTQRVEGPNGDITTLEYDSVGRVVRSDNADRGRSALVYNRDGRLARTEDANGNVTTFEYDVLGRPTQRSSTGTAGTRTYRFLYDASDMANGLGQLTGVDGPVSAERFSYTRDGEVAGERLSLDGRVFQQSSRYNAAGDIVGLTYPDGAVLDIERDGQGNIVRQTMRDSVDATPQLVAEYPRYSALDQPLEARYGNGVATAWTYYDYAVALGRPHTLEVRDAQARSLQRDTLQWNKAGQVAARTLQRHDAPALAFSYAYDTMGWLRRAEGGGHVFEFDYDKAGNVTLKDGVQYSYQAATNRLATGSNGLAATHDASGNVTALDRAGDDVAFTYDSENAMAAVTRAGTPVTQADYDHAGRRLRRIDANGDVSLYVSGDYDVTVSSGRTLHTRYVSGPQGRIAAFTTDRSTAAAQHDVAWSSGVQSLAMFDGGSGGIGSRALALAIALPDAWSALDLRTWLPVTLFALVWLAALLASLLVWRAARRQRASGAELFRSAVSPWLLAFFVFGLAPQRVDAALGAGGGLPTVGVRYFSSDHLGSSTVITDAQGELSTLLAYQPFGAIDADASQGANDFRPKFTGKELDSDSGLYYFDARYLDPALGRFLQPDPQSQFASPYAYAGNDPLTLVDPDGEIAFAAVVAIMAAVGAVVGAYSGAAAVNQSFNPGAWDWRAGKTYAGVFAGAAIGAVGGALGPVAAEAGVAVGIAGEIAIGAGESAAFTALGGGSPKEILESALIGGLTGGLVAGAGAGASRVAGRFAGRGEAALSEEAAQAIRGSRSGLAADAAGEAGALESRAVNSADSVGARRSLGPSEFDDPGALGGACMFSFVAGTLVATSTGAVPIESIAVHDRVWGRGDDGTVALFGVTELFQRQADTVVDVHVGNSHIRTTPEHPFWVADAGWLEATDLEIGQHLLARDGRQLPIAAVEHAAADATVYNFEVDDAHSYFVGGDDDVLVHNAKCKTRRELALGRTPGKGSRTGREVEARMRAAGKVRGAGKSREVFVRITSGGPRKWVPLDANIHMGHRVDAVSWWNSGGYLLGAKSKGVRKWMLSSKIYRFEWGPLNSSNGAKLGLTYRAPSGWTGTWP